MPEPCTPGLGPSLSSESRVTASGASPSAPGALLSHLQADRVGIQDPEGMSGSETLGPPVLLSLLQKPPGAPLPGRAEPSCPQNPVVGTATTQPRGSPGRAGCGDPGTGCRREGSPSHRLHVHTSPVASVSPGSSPLLSPHSCPFTPERPGFSTAASRLAWGRSGPEGCYGSPSQALADPMSLCPDLRAPQATRPLLPCQGQRLPS